ncbi:hypothetical protein [Azospirillum endophyticum]
MGGDRIAAGGCCVETATPGDPSAHGMSALKAGMYRIARRLTRRSVPKI